MRFIHLSDLHLGKRVNEFSMLEDQEYILDRIFDIICAEKPDAVLICGDVYDKSVPSAEAVQLFDRFLTRLSSSTDCKILIISGNHDSAERLSFGASLMEREGVYISPVYNGEIKSVTLEDRWGEVCFYLMPFLKPSHVRRYFDGEIESYTEAVRTVVDSMEIKDDRRNVLLAHQLVTGAKRCESEDISVGGLDNVDIEALERFDYVALGHLHSAQRCGSDKIRYCGTPLKYSFSEAKDEKSVTVADLYEKGRLEIREIPLVPMRDMVEIKGSYEELMERSFYGGSSYQTDYTHITLTDEEDIVDAIGRIRTVYKNLMRLDYDNTRTRAKRVIESAERQEEKSPLELFEELYMLQNNQPLSQEQRELVLSLIEEIWEGEE
ncbi:MAG: exonuclease SbcCD subunit D [Clostridia bacterium]|nr:exonuclease SbcCD subunit D [Clostridia bacterium]